MDRNEVARVLDEIAVLLELAGENPFKARSYAQVARQVEQLEEDLGVLVREGRLREIKGVGEALEKKIEELARTGVLEYHQKLRAQFPESLFELFGIPGLGPKRIRALYEELQVASLGELEYACHENRLVSLNGFGAKMQAKVLEGIEFAKRGRGLFLCGQAQEEAERLRGILEAGPEVVRVEVAGSLRRCKEVVKDIDLIAASGAPEGVMERFVGSEGVVHVVGRGETKTSVVLASGMGADLRVVGEEAFPYALHHFTGSKEHNVVMRQRAKERGLKLNEYGLFRGEECVPCASEEDLFEALGLPYIPPELREDRGEFELDRTPRLVERGDLVGVFHCHTRFSDGGMSLEELAERAADRGYGYVVVADHSRSAGYAGGLSVERVLEQHGRIDALNRKGLGARLLKGIESDIRGDGSLDYDDEVLARFDCVIASVHSGFGMSEAQATKRLVRAIEHPATTILGHPTGRLLLARAGYPVDMEAVFEACAAHGTAIEINANPHRLDLDWRYVRRAKERGVKLCIAPDAHSVAGLDDVVYGLGIAPVKGWLGPEDLLNCMGEEDLLAWRNSGSR